MKANPLDETLDVGVESCRIFFDQRELHRKTDFVGVVHDFAPGVERIFIREVDLNPEQLFWLYFSPAKQKAAADAEAGNGCLTPLDRPFPTRWQVYLLAGSILALGTVVATVPKALMAYFFVGLSVNAHYYLTTPLPTLFTGNTAAEGALTIPLALLPGALLLGSVLLVSNRGTGSFRPVSPVVFVVVAEGIGACERLESHVRSGVLWRPVHFAYHPHVTIAHDLPDSVLEGALGELADWSADFEVDRFSLYEHVAGAWVAQRTFRFGTAG